MPASNPRERPSVQMDPKGFVGDPDLIRLLEQHSVPAPCDADGALFRQGDLPASLYIFHDGMVTLSMNSDDSHSLFAAQALPGSLLGLPAVISNQPYTITATACAGARVSFISRQDFSRLMLSFPPLSVRILKVLAAQVRSARRALY